MHGLGEYTVQMSALPKAIYRRSATTTEIPMNTFCVWGSEKKSPYNSYGIYIQIAKNDVGNKRTKW